MTSAIVFIFALWVIMITGIGAHYACDEKYTNITEKHTMCKAINKNCNFIRHKGKVFAEQLLRTHNMIRNSIRRFVGKEYRLATNMELMQWNEELYEMARMHSFQCVEKPDCDLCHQIGDFPVEQNFAVRKFKKSKVDHSGPVKRFQTVIKEWATELQQYDPSVVSNLTTDGRPTNWVNILRATTSYVGCASMNFYSDEPGIFKEVYVCNYGPANLTEGEEIYKTGGGSCSDCEYHGVCDTEFKHLCVPSELELNLTIYYTEEEGTTQETLPSEENYYFKTTTNQEANSMGPVETSSVSESSWEKATESTPIINESTGTSVTEETTPTEEIYATGTTPIINEATGTSIMEETTPTEEIYATGTTPLINEATGTSITEETAPTEEIYITEVTELLPTEEYNTIEFEGNEYLSKRKIHHLILNLLKYSAKQRKRKLQ